MSQKIQVRRGVKERVPVLDSGELGFATDTKELFVGSPGGNVQLAKQEDVDIHSEQIGSLLEKTDGLNTQLVERVTKTELQNAVTTKADQSFVDAQFDAIVSGAPKGTYATLIDLQNTYPNGAEGVYLVLENGHWYYWNKVNLAWTDGGLYQATNSNDFIAENIINNGDFSTITGSLIDGWVNVQYFGSLSIANNIGTLTVTEPAAASRIEQRTPVIKTGHKYYSRALIKPKYPNETYFRFGDNIGTRFYPVANIWNTISHINTANKDSSFMLYHRTDTNYIVGDTIEFKNIISIDLTVTFGVGNEPTLSEMDKLVEKYGGFFNGVKSPFLDNRDLYFELKKDIEPVKINGKTFEDLIVLNTQMQSKSTLTSYGAQLSPTLSSWTGVNATWDGLKWLMGTEGAEISTTIPVTTDKYYLIDITISAINDVRRMPISFGSLYTELFNGTDGVFKTLFKANETGTIPIKIGDRATDWKANSISGISIREVTAFPSMTTLIGGYMPVWSIGNNFAIGGGHSKRTSPMTYNTGLGFESQMELATGTQNVGIGARAQQNAIDASYNVAAGYQAQQKIISGSYNNGVGIKAQRDLTYGSWNNAFGNEAQISLIDGNSNIGIGRQAQFLMKRGNWNTGVGARTMYQPGISGSVSRATIEGNYMSCFGARTGASSTDNADFLVAAGYQSIGTENATAVGAQTEARGKGSVAIGRDADGNAAIANNENEFVLGTEKHNVKVKGSFNLARYTPSSSSDTKGQVGDITTDDNYVYVKTTAGWKRTALEMF